jgi:hypothetical protein
LKLNELAGLDVGVVMTSEDMRSMLDREPFIPLLVHMVSGTTIEVRRPGDATLLQNSVMILQQFDPRFEDAGYDLVSLRNIERIEQKRQIGRGSAAK